ncbi:MAG: putative LPS assembly protein LptD [Bacteroidales bacterium]|jgi:lipopolysaccharide assembly outer membrane protein LptD (OstA)|nr:putative LPS assembly protein LptD [Bacteroidales bacterium]MDX9797961.1 putative LPS assembly protein LptD [Bacteroidales bacterium]
MFLCILPLFSYSQNEIDSTSNLLSSNIDSLNIVSDTIISKNDTIKAPRRKKTFDERVNYSSKDSVAIDLSSKKVYLYNDSQIKMGKIELVAGHISIGFDSKQLHAEGIEDSSKNISQYPIFKEGGKEYKSKVIDYNIESKKGLISGVFTKEGEGYLHGQQVKKIDDKTMFIRGGVFTTCELEHPHFAINFNKAKVITQDKIVTGPAWFSVLDIPLPLAIPFGYFPFTDQKKSGFLMPTYGYAQNRGYYLRNIGWYFAISDYIDLTLQADIYTNLSWAGNIKSSYAKRYKYRGGFDLRYEVNKTGISNTPTYNEQADFRFRWTHNQDAKSHPYRNFSANVNLVSSTFNQYAVSTSDYFNNTTTSSIAFSTRFGQKVSFTANLGEVYNANTGAISLDLPSISISTSQFYPFRRKQMKGKARWYEDISISYRTSLANSINTYDSLLLTKEIVKYMKNGMHHSIPIQSNVKVFKHLNWTNSINYNERWYLNYITKRLDPLDTNQTAVLKDTIMGFFANRDANFSSNLNTRIYGMFTFKKGYLKAIRHVINPAISFTYTPDFSNPSLGFYDFYLDRNNNKVYYSRTEDGMFGSPPNGQSGILGFSVGNNLEIKVKSSKDTVTGTSKVTLLESLNIASGYDLAKDSVNWQPLRLNARTTLFKRLIINFSASYTPYAIDSMGRLTNQFLINTENKLFKRQNSQWDLNLSWQLTGKKGKSGSDNNPQNNEFVSPSQMTYSPFVNPNEILGHDVDFTIPWSLNLGLTYSQLSSFVVAIAGYETNQSAVFNIRGDINLTPKWKIGITSGYDFINKDYTYTSIDFYRDLHCWEMRMNWVPFGFRQGWNFTIAIKASMLQDLKYELRDDFRNRVQY